MSEMEHSHRRFSLSDGERLAVQEALAEVFREDMKELKDAVGELSANISHSAQTLGDKMAIAMGRQTARISTLELAQIRTRSFVAGLACAFSFIGSGLGFLIEWGVRSWQGGHGAG